MKNSPDKIINTKEVFGISCNFDVLGFNSASEHVP